MKNKLVVERITKREDGTPLIIFEVMDDAPTVTTLTFGADQMPEGLLDQLKVNLYLMAEYDAERILSAELLPEESDAALKSAQNRLHALFAKGKRKK